MKNLVFAALALAAFAAPALAKLPAHPPLPPVRPVFSTDAPKFTQRVKVATYCTTTCYGYGNSRTCNTYCY